MNKFRIFLSCLLLMGWGNGISVFAARLVLVAGGGESELDGGAARQAKLKEPFGVAFDDAGNMFIIEMASGNRLLKMDPEGRLHHVAGLGTLGGSGDNGPARQAEFNGAHNIAILPEGDVLIADTWNGRIRRVNPATGIIRSLPGFDVGSDQGKRAGPYCITLDFPGTHLYIADLRRVHRLDVAAGQAAVVAGNGRKGIPEDGAQAIEAPLVDPRAVAVDRRGNLYILERGGHALRVVDASGTIRTVINGSGQKGAEGDGGNALQATLNGPKHLCIDSEDNVIIADAENHLIRKYVPATGMIYRVAGTGRKGSAGLNGPPEEAELARPHGVTVHPRTGELYITDSYNNRILKVLE